VQLLDQAAAAAAASAALLCWQAVLKEVSDSNGKIVLFIDEIHTVVGAGATGGAMDAGEL
jgi:ATP-dependent Clp protease ATP-binding subunit ClpA